MERNYEAGQALSVTDCSWFWPERERERERDLTGAAFSIRPLSVQICYQAGAGAEIVTAVL
jgi:hypothetical protein